MPDDTQQPIPTGPSLAAGGNPQEHHMHHARRGEGPAYLSSVRPTIS